MDQLDRREATRWCFRLLLGREPDESAVDFFERTGPASTIVQSVLASVEFKGLHHRFAGHLVDRWVMYEHPLGFKLWLNLGDAAVCWCILDHDFEPAEIDFVRQHVHRGMHALDIGANVGFFTMLLAGIVGEDGSVNAFEPHPLIHRYAVRSGKANGFTQVKIHCCALGDHDGDAILGTDKRSSNKGAFSIFSSDRLTDYIECHNVPLRRLATFDLPKIDFIKIDSEGSEFVALSPFMDRIGADKPVILSEVAPQMLAEVSGVTAKTYISMITDVGYDCVDLATSERFADLGARPFANVAFIPH